MKTIRRLSTLVACGALLCACASGSPTSTRAGSAIDAAGYAGAIEESSLFAEFERPLD